MVPLAVLISLLVLPGLFRQSAAETDLAACSTPDGCAAAAGTGRFAEAEDEEQALLQLERHSAAAASAEETVDDTSFPNWRKRNAVDVFVMLSLTTVNPQTGRLEQPKVLRSQLEKIKQTGATGVMTDVWWGLTEKVPKQYDFSAYRELVDMLKEIGLKVQFVTSFHQCGDAGDPSIYIPLPSWLTKESGLWFKNALGHETKAYISLFADDVKIGGRSGRTPVQMYEDWMHAMEREFRKEICGGTLVEVMVGMGTDGELKYPSYENGPWTFPGIGMFQAFDKHALAHLQTAARIAGKPASWGVPPGVDETGNSDSFPQNTTFFGVEAAGWTSAKAKFFLRWYSGALMEHAATILPRARAIFGHKLRLSGKISGVHWWYKYPSHAAEVNAGYYNTNDNDGYRQLADVFRNSGDVAVDFTCLEMQDGSQPADCDCGPQELVLQVQKAAQNARVLFTGENALSFYDAPGYNQMVSYKPPTGYLESVTYLRLSDEFLEQKNLDIFARFVSRMANKGFTTPWTV